MLTSTQTVLSRPSTPNKSIKSISTDTNFFALNTYEENNKEVRSPTSVACTNNSEKTRVTHSSSSAFASGSFFDQQYIDCLYLDFDLTFSLTSTVWKTKVVGKGLLTSNSQTTELPFIFTAIHCDLHSPFTPKKSSHLLIHLSLTITQETHCNFLI